MGRGKKEGKGCLRERGGREGKKERMEGEGERKEGKRRVERARYN